MKHLIYLLLTFPTFIYPAAEWPVLFYNVLNQSWPYTLFALTITFIAQLIVLLAILHKQHSWWRITLAALLSSGIGMLFGWLEGNPAAGAKDTMGGAIGQVVWLLVSMNLNAILLGFALWLLLRPMNFRKLSETVIFSQVAYWVALFGIPVIGFGLLALYSFFTGYFIGI